MVASTNWWNTSAAIAPTLPDRTAEIDVVSIDGSSDTGLPTDASRILRNALDAVQAQNQSVSAASDGPVLTAAQERNIRVEAARRFHMLREHEADRLQGRMTPEDHDRFMLIVAIPIVSEKMERISARQQVGMEKVLKIGRAHV